MFEKLLLNLTQILLIHLASEDKSNDVNCNFIIFHEFYHFFLTFLEAVVKMEKNFYFHLVFKLKISQIHNSSSDN